MPFTTRILAILTYPQYARTLDCLVEQDSWFRCDNCKRWRMLKEDAGDPEAYRICADADRKCTEAEDKQYVMKRGDVSVCVIVSVYDMT